MVERMKLIVAAILGFISAGAVTLFVSGGGDGIMKAGLSAVPWASAAEGCHSSYRGACLPSNGPDIDCAGQNGDGPLFVMGPFKVVGDDDYDLDVDKDGVACEYYPAESPLPRVAGVLSREDVPIGR